MRTWASSRLSNCQLFSSSSRRRPLNDSIQAFCHGEPGSMNAVPTPLKRHQSATALAMNSGPLSNRTNAGAPRGDHEPVETGDHTISVDRTLDHDGRALAGELVDDIEQLQGAAVDGDVELEVQGPQGVRRDRAHRPGV